MESKLETGKRSGLLVAAGILIGAGLLAGFVDGILLHEILQWHHMFTSIRPATNLSNLEANTLADGLFHLGTWTLSVIGLLLLWRAGGRSDIAWSSKIFGGSLLLGAGLFDFIEGLIDHQILGIHHVKPGPNQLAWDIGFLTLGAILALVGWVLLRSGQKENSSQA
ncbi:DUF2243 domain-containing protein [Allocoleopsis franciscana]|uniref:Putative membrane protein n=1 Tax=Allocoleopsis franciscana PCC 7113 TaxID=1173027 RepID=K9W9Z6_9CYAN|nr:DUF2243 domain-containing protein [Allocoleopsis franciscana]AFZ16569.1 putative membrane protein [Allocoleopsis franciscana PCC 7113]